jgi:hypothetical protein
MVETRDILCAAATAAASGELEGPEKANFCAQTSSGAMPRRKTYP